MVGQVHPCLQVTDTEVQSNRKQLQQIAFRARPLYRDAQAFPSWKRHRAGGLSKLLKLTYYTRLTDPREK